MVRSSLGRSIELSTIRTSTGSYGFYALPVADLLELTEWVPHQDLLAAGKLVEVKPDDTETEVVFCSHQWTSFDAPDPTMDQLRVLQSVIRKLMAGKTDVRSNGMLDAVYQYQMRSSGSDWAKALPKMCFWLDYFCMPQPGALIANASDELKAKLDTNNDGIVSQAELADAALEPGSSATQGPTTGCCEWQKTPNPLTPWAKAPAPTLLTAGLRRVRHAGLEMPMPGSRA